MSELTPLLAGLYTIMAIMVVLWICSVLLRNVSIIDIFWGPVLAAAAISYWWPLVQPGPRANLVLVLVCLWALRLAVYLLARNYGQPEDRRYVEMRTRNDPGWWLKSLLFVFAFQGLLAWLISFPVFGAMQGAQPLALLDYAGVAIFAYGLVWESLADWQLARFLRYRTNKEAVMDRGVWRYSRHPNYFGEFCLWWGLYLLALSAGAWWTIVGPLLLSFFLLRVSGVAMLEKDIAGRRPAYQEYVRKTSAFVPRLPRS